MSSDEPDTTKATPPKSTRKGPHGLKGVRGLKGVSGLRGADDIRGIHSGVKGVSSLPGATQLRGTRNIQGINERNPKIETGISLVQAMLQYGLKSNIEKLQENVGNLRTHLKENLQSGLQNNLPVHTHNVDGSSHEKEKAMADTNVKEDTEQGVEKNAEGVTPASGEPTGANAESTSKPEQPDIVEGGKTEAGELNIESIQDLLQRFSRGFKTTKETLDMVASGVNTAQDVLSKTPGIERQPGLSSIRDTLNKVSKGVNTAQGILNKVAPLVEAQANSKFLLTTLGQVVAGVHAIHEILDQISATLRSLQDLLRKVASGVRGLGQLASLVGKIDAIHSIQRTFLSVIHTLQDIIRKIIGAIGKAQSVLLGMIAALVGPRHKEEERAAVSPAGETTSAATLDALRRANIINMDTPLKSIIDQLKDLQPEAATGWGVLEDSGHMVLVWSGQ
jgi:hypothetical protein